MLNHQTQFQRKAIVIASLALLAVGGATVACADDSHFFGRWTVETPNEKFSAKGIDYKTFDVAPCGADFCGVSVSDKGNCGGTLFRFLTIHAQDETLHGHGHWGKLKKNIALYTFSKTEKSDMLIDFNLGDGYDFGDREGSMPTYQATHQRTGDASCVAK